MNYSNYHTNVDFAAMYAKSAGQWLCIMGRRSDDYRYGFAYSKVNACIAELRQLRRAANYIIDTKPMLWEQTSKWITLSKATNVAEMEIRAERDRIWLDKDRADQDAFEAGFEQLTEEKLAKHDHVCFTRDREGWEEKNFPVDNCEFCGSQYCEGPWDCD